MGFDSDSPPPESTELEKAMAARQRGMSLSLSSRDQPSSEPCSYLCTLGHWADSCGARCYNARLVALSSPVDYRCNPRREHGDRYDEY